MGSTVTSLVLASASGGEVAMAMDNSTLSNMTSFLNSSVSAADSVFPYTCGADFCPIPEVPVYDANGTLIEPESAIPKDTVITINTLLPPFL